MINDIRFARIGLVGYRRTSGYWLEPKLGGEHIALPGLLQTVLPQMAGVTHRLKPLQLLNIDLHQRNLAGPQNKASITRQ